MEGPNKRSAMAKKMEGPNKRSADDHVHVAHLIKRAANLKLGNNAIRGEWLKRSAQYGNGKPALGGLNDDGLNGLNGADRGSKRAARCLAGPCCVDGICVEVDGGGNVKRSANPCCE